MKKIFPHKHIVNLLAFTALTMAVVFISAPEVEIYNQKVSVEQKRIRIEADGATDREISFSFGYHYTTSPVFFAEVAFFLILFFSLSLTKKIGFSFLLAFLYISQFYIFLKLFTMTVEVPMSYFVNTPAYSILFVACVIALTYWETSLISQVLRRISSRLRHPGK